LYSIHPPKFRDGALNQATPSSLRILSNTYSTVILPFDAIKSEPASLNKLDKTDRETVACLIAWRMEGVFVLPEASTVLVRNEVSSSYDQC
jgi:hypothetical protein